MIHGREQGPASFQSATLAKDDLERTALSVLTEMEKREGMMSVPPDDGRLLRILVESLGAKSVVELGTSQGYSAVAMGLALRRTGGHLTTFEIDAQVAAIARENFRRARLAAVVTLVEGDAHALVLQHVKGPVDLLFLDADKEGYLDYLQKLLPRVRAGGLIVAHNMNAHQADPRYVKAITTSRDLETVFINRGQQGIGLTLKKR